MSETNPANGTEATRTRRTQAQMAEARGDVPISDSLLARIVEVTEQRIATRPNPMSLDTFEQIEAFAIHAARTNMIPKDYVGKPDNIILAVMQGKELGLPPIQAIQSIAMVNGRPSVWGDAVPGLCYARGLVEDHEEHFEGTEGADDFTAICTVKRKGVASIKTARFSQGDAKKAGLYGQNVHGKYPRRMMQWRARHSAFHDAFPDVLRGIGTREIEAEDAVATPGWTMPQPEKGWFTAKAKASGDDWDNTWFTGVVAQLAGEPNAWKWVDLLVMYLGQAPTIRDVQEIEELQVVIDVRASAPAEGKQAIEAGFNGARERLGTRAQFKPQTEQKTAPVSAAAPRQAETQAAARGPDPQTSAVAFSEYLVAGDGTEFADSDGVIEAITDPMKFVAAYADVRATLFPADQEAFDTANHDALQRAQAAQPGVAAAIVAARGATDSATSQPDGVGDPDRVFAPPAKPTKADYDKYEASLTQVFAACLTPDAINHVIDVNEPTYGKFPPSHRLACKAIVEARQKAISPASERNTTRSHASIADSLLLDIASLDTLADLDTFLAYAPNAGAIADLAREAPAQHGRIVAAEQMHRKQLTDLAVTPKPAAPATSLFGDEAAPAAPTPRQIADKMLAALEACQTRAEVNAWGGTADAISDGKFLQENHPELWAEVAKVGSTRHKPVAA